MKNAMLSPSVRVTFLTSKTIAQCKNTELRIPGKSSKDVYRMLYWKLKSQELANEKKTYVFPDWVRVVLRERFGSDGTYDEQYNEREDIYNVTNEDLVCASWHQPPDDCYFCGLPMPPTP